MNPERELVTKSRSTLFHAGAVTLATYAMLLVGCSQSGLSVADTLPKATQAWPWTLQGDIWSGTFEQAAGAFGEETQQWGDFAPDQVWLAIYRHESRPEHKLTVRALAFSGADLARRAFDHFRPVKAQEFQAGDAGCWTADGVLVLWGRMVFDIFSAGGANAASSEQAAYLLGFIEKRMPPELPDDPR